MRKGCPACGIRRHPFLLFPSAAASFQHQNFAPLAGWFPVRGVFFWGASEIESCRDPCQAGGILFHVVEFCDLRRGVAQEVGHLPGREGADGSIRLFDAVDQIGGEGVAEGMEVPVAPVQPPPECGSIVSESSPAGYNLRVRRRGRKLPVEVRQVGSDFFFGLQLLVSDQGSQSIRRLTSAHSSSLSMATICRSIRRVAGLSDSCR